MTTTYLDHAAVARSIELLAEIRGNYETITKRYPKSDTMAYYVEHIQGLGEAMDILASTQPRQP